MLQNYDVDIKDFLSLTNSGLKVADFVQVKAAIIKRYKETYGSDIDLSTASADGIFVNDLALIINNILKTVSAMYSNLDVNSASGIYLDILCRLSNIKRKNASNSYASIEIKNLNTSESIDIPANLEFIDAAGTQWTADNEATTLEPQEEMSILVTCTETGPVEAPAGYINQTIDASLNISIIQSADAIVGTNGETDDELRERRAQSNGAQGITVLESLYGALREIAAIDDVKIYNAANKDIPALDGTTVVQHDIYVILRLKQDIKISDSIIGSLIYEKLTPGISTTAYTGSDNGIAKSYDYIPTIIGTKIDDFTQKVNWKQAKPITPTLNITITPATYFDADLTESSSWSTTENTFAVIARETMAYMNALPLGTTPSAFDLKLAVLDADPLFKTRHTYSVDSITPIATNPDTYYNYTSFTVRYDDNNHKYIIALQ